MGTLILISGPNDSGKSGFAEHLVSRTEGGRYYIATMIPRTQGNHIRVEKHKKQREGLGFTTLELPYQVADAPVSPDSVVLLEDVSNLLANVIFEKGGNGSTVCGDILALAARCRLLIAVTISGLPAADYTGETLNYITVLNEVNTRLFENADGAVSMCAGVPLWQKGDLDVIF